MQPERWRQIDQLFHLVLAKPRDERGLFLAESCAGDARLQKEVEDLILSHEQADEFIESPASDLAADVLSKGQAGLKFGERIGPYEIQSVLGIGGMGEVYLASDTRLGRQVALKILPPRFTLDPERVSRFEKEARAALALNHPNIVTIHEIGHFNNARFIVTEFVEGHTLRQLMIDRPFTLNEALNVTIQVAVALSSAHAAGIVHRDIKPENIMLRADGYVKILDFGLAKLTEMQTSDSDPEMPTLLQSNPGLLMGTVQYMSPEQARSKKVDGRTDVWSLGIVLYELLTGQVPFSGETPSHALVSLMEDELPPLTDYPNVPAELGRIVTKALRKNQKDRYESAREFADDLKGLKRELQIESRLKGMLEAVPGKRTREVPGKDTQASAPSLDRVAPKIRAALPIVLLVLLIGAGIGGYLSLKYRSRIRANDSRQTFIKADLIAIPGGIFQVGRDDSSITEAPAHEVQVQSFEMDRTEVTNAEYGQFVTETNHVPPEQWEAVTPPVGQERLPVSRVSYDDAVAFAAWRSKRDGVTYRLPTEDEWEYAARNGDQNSLYPWGNTFEWGRAATLEASVNREQPVGSYPSGANRWGVHDLIGNVSEWTSSKASVYEGNKLPLPPQFKDWIVVRGGNWTSSQNKLSAAQRDWFAPIYKSRLLGFRLVKVASRS